jgi:hypothetical protein
MALARPRKQRKRCETCGALKPAGQLTRHLNEKKLRQQARSALADVVKGRTDDAVIGPISSPYTD